MARCPIPAPFRDALSTQMAQMTVVRERARRQDPRTTRSPPDARPLRPREHARDSSGETPRCPQRRAALRRLGVDGHALDRGRSRRDLWRLSRRHAGHRLERPGKAQIYPAIARPARGSATGACSLAAASSSA